MTDSVLMSAEPASAAESDSETSLAQSSSFPWRHALLGTTLLFLALLTVSARGDVVAEGRQVMLLQLRRASLERRVGELQMRLETQWHALQATRPGTKS